MKDHIIFFISILKRECEGAFIVGEHSRSVLPTCCFERGVEDEGVVGIVFQVPPDFQHSLCFSPDSSPSPSEGFSLFLWHPFSLNSFKLLVSQDMFSKLL